MAEESPRLHRQDRARPASVSAAASRTRWPFGWAATSRQPFRFTAPRRWRLTCAKIKAAVLVHHGEKDTRLASTWPDYDKALTEAKVPHEGYIYPDAVHGFNNDATPERYNKAAADQAWQRTIAWFNKYVRG